MLDINTFSKWLNLMSELYQKPISEALEDFFYEEWNTLTNIQFERGARLVMRKDQRFPTIERLIELARSTSEVRRPERSEYQPDTRLQAPEYDPMSSEAIAARARVREQLAQLRQARVTAAESPSGLTSLADVLGVAPEPPIMISPDSKRDDAA